MAEIVRSERQGNVAVVTLNRPDQLNAVGTALLDALDAALADAVADDTVGAVVVAGEGRAFSAGADVAEFGALETSLQWHAFLERIGDSYERLERLPLPTVAAVDGVALGGGFELALACDLRIASTRARFGLPEIKLGILPGAGGTQRLPRRIPPTVAKHLILTGDNLSADDAYRLGLVNQVVGEGEALAAAVALAERLATGPRASIAAAKRLLDDGLDMPLDQALAYEREVVGHLFSTADAREGIAAFLEKRPAQFGRG